MNTSPKLLVQVKIFAEPMQDAIVLLRTAADMLERYDRHFPGSMLGLYPLRNEKKEARGTVEWELPPL